MSSSDVYSEDDEQLSETPVTPRASRGTRARALKALRSSSSKDSIDSYVKLFQETYQKAETDETFNTTQDGVVTWTPQEKRILFDVLARKGRNGLREISATIGSKSELEVQEYLRLLQKGVRRQHFNDGHSRAAVLGDIPAAAEISQKCCELLDQPAELICLEEQRVEDNVGRRKYANTWIIDEEVAGELENEHAENDQNDGSSEIDQGVLHKAGFQDRAPSSTPSLSPAATLFKLINWITLSERLFMNFGAERLEDNWVNLAFKDESPSMTADVATQFHEIAFNLTRRLIHAAHFFAASRVRRSGTANRPSATVVKVSDVRSAARTLNMMADSSEYWIGLARRCSLEVEDSRHLKGWDSIPLDHDEVEALLSQNELPTEPYEISTSNHLPRERSSSVASTGSADSLREESSDSEDEHAEAVDRQQSSAEELLCWTALGQTPVTSELDSRNQEIPPRPAGKRKTTEELVDWRDRTLYRSEWEEFDCESKDLESEFESQRKKRRVTALSSLRPLSELRAQNTGPESQTDQNDIQEHTTPFQSKPNLNIQSDESDPEFQPGSPGVSKSKSSKNLKRQSDVSRTSSRKRPPVSYAVPTISEFDAEMDVDINSDSENQSAEIPGSEKQSAQRAEIESKDEDGGQKDTRSDSGDSGSSSREEIASHSDGVHDKDRVGVHSPNNASDSN